MYKFTDEEKEMLLYLGHAITRCGGTELEFFQTSYYWKFSKHYDCVVDVAQYRLHAIIPKYVEDYIHHLQSTSM